MGGEGLVGCEGRVASSGLGIVGNLARIKWLCLWASEMTIVAMMNTTRNLWIGSMSSTPKSKPFQHLPTSKTPSSFPISENGSTVDRPTLYPDTIPKQTGPEAPLNKNDVAKLHWKHKRRLRSHRLQKPKQKTKTNLVFRNGVTLLPRA